MFDWMSNRVLGSYVVLMKYKCSRLVCVQSEHLCVAPGVCLTAWDLSLSLSFYLLLSPCATFLLLQAHL